MAINNHKGDVDSRQLLDIKLFSQPLSGFSVPNLQLDECKFIARLFTKLENTISVLSDMKSRKSYIYTGGLGDQLGFEPSQTEINSIWEDELLGRVHPEDLQKKYRLELQFFKLVKSMSLTESVNYNVVTKLRIKDNEGKYLLVRHRLLYLSSMKNGDVWLALCLYDMVHDYPGFDAPDGLIINTSTGEIIESDQSRFLELLSAREQQVIQLIHLGLRSKEIASELSLSVHTVNRHRQNIFQKLNVNSAIEACRIANATGLVGR